MGKLNLIVEDSIRGPEGGYGYNPETDHTCFFDTDGNGRDIPWRSELAGNITSIDIDKILSQLSASLLSQGIKQEDIDNIVSAIRSYVSGIINPKISDIYTAINLLLATSSLGLSDDIVKQIVSDSINGFPDYATHEEVQKVDSDLQAHIGSDADLYQNMYKAIMSEVQKTIAGTVPNYDMDNPEVIEDAAGALIAVDLGKTWTAPTGGKFVMIYKATVLGVSPVVTKNGETIFSDGLGILGLTNGEPVTERIVVGDVIEISGSLGLLTSFNVTFYPVITV
jgi:hypothetical protein